MNASQKYKVIFWDGSSKITDKFTLMAKFGNFLFEDKNGTLSYKNNLFSFSAYVLENINI